MEAKVPLKRFVVLFRVLELLASAVVLSAVITLFNVMGLVVKRYLLVLTILAFNIIYVLFNISKLKMCYYDLRNKKNYYALAFLSHLIFAAINVLCYTLFSNKVYAWAFSITKILTYTGINTKISIFFFHLIGIVTIFIASIGMEKILKETEKKEKAEELAIDE